MPRNENISSSLESFPITSFLNYVKVRKLEYNFECLGDDEWG